MNIWSNHYSNTLIAERVYCILSSLNLASKPDSFKYFYSKVGWFYIFSSMSSKSTVSAYFYYYKKSILG
jgi:hypothetical protein